MLKTRGVSFEYKGGSVLKFPDIEAKEKESMLLLGRSGIGKTTLLHLLGGLMQPATGTIAVDQQDLALLSGRNLDRFRGNHIGIVFQQNHFIESLNVVENITLAQTLIGLKADRNRAMHLLDHLGLKGKEYKKTHQLSQGERQRVAIARAVINKPGLILADEPTSALDDIHCEIVFRMLEDQAIQENSALVIVTHDTRLKDLVKQQIVLQ
ncbi:MAG: ATP-binding cassette domain-containing protein [Saprospiraceae bacterium]|nr:ATP-binding cassette domain-containing protein [Saprospiraceae bacterium]